MTFRCDSGPEFDENSPLELALQRVFPSGEDRKSNGINRANNSKCAALAANSNGISDQWEIRSSTPLPTV